MTNKYPASCLSSRFQVCQWYSGEHSSSWCLAQGVQIFFQIGKGTSSSNLALNKKTFDHKGPLLTRVREHFCSPGRLRVGGWMRLTCTSSPGGGWESDSTCLSDHWEGRWMSLVCSTRRTSKCGGKGFCGGPCKSIQKRETESGMFSTVLNCHILD